MEIIIDARENFLLKNPLLDTLTYIKQELPVGDILINTEQGNYLIERKTYSDLISSIQDGRYNEQKQRLKEWKNNEEGKCIIYLLEGPYLNFNKENNEEIIRGCIVGMTIRDNIKVWQTRNNDESCKLLLKFIKKISDKTFMDTKNVTQNIFKKRSDNIIPETFFYNMLCMIPSVSNNSANVIVEKYENLGKFYEELKVKRENIIDEIANLKHSRKLGKKLAENVFNFIMYSKDK